MDPAEKKIALRAINYGLHVLTTTDGENFGAGGVNWITQTSFDPPLVAAGVKGDSGSAAIIESTRAFAVNVLGADQLDVGKAHCRSSLAAVGDKTFWALVCLTKSSGGRSWPISPRSPLLVR